MKQQEKKKDHIWSGCLVATTVALGLLLGYETHPRVFALGVAILFLSAGVSVITWATGRGVRSRTIALLIVYICVLTAYGSVYYILYLNNPFAYSFTTSINEGRVSEGLDASVKYVSELDTELFMLNLLYSDPEKGLQAIIKRDATPLSDGYLVSFRSATGGGGFIGIVMTDYTIKFSKSGEEFFFAPKQIRKKVYNATRELYSAKTAEEVRNSVSSVIKAVEEERDEARTQMARRQAGIPEWNLIDFCYFSTSTMTTIGYGDIIPNSTSVRLVVMSQALVGVVLAGFAFSLLWPPITKDVELTSSNSPTSPAQDCEPSSHSAPQS